MSARRFVTFAVLTAAVASVALFGAACAPDSGQPKDVASIAKAFVAAWPLAVGADKDVDAVISFYAEDAVLEAAVADERYVGRAAIAQLLQAASVPDKTLVFAAGTGRNWFAFREERSIGTDATTYFVVCQVEDGLITYQWQSSRAGFLKLAKHRRF